MLHRNDDRWTRDEQLTGEQKPTQVGAALQSLGITPIFALTPQAKDRIERLFGVLQDRLIVEMEILNIKVMAAPNTFLRGHFIEDDNRRFAREPEVSQRAWQRVGKDVDIERTIRFPSHAVGGNDNTVRLGGIVRDLPEGPEQSGYAKERMEVGGCTTKTHS